jgi:hypothetical protein
MTTWTTPDSTPTGQFTGSRWNTYIRDNLIYLHDLATLFVLNSSGVAWALGSVVAISAVADLVGLTTTTIGDARLMGVAQSNIADGTSGYVAVLGRVNAMNVTGAVARQQPVQASGTAQYGQQGAGNAFATSLTAFAGPGNGSISAFIHNRGPVAAHTIQDTGSSKPQRTKLNFIGFTVADNSGADSTDVTAPVQVILPDYVTGMFYS